MNDELGTCEWKLWTILGCYPSRYLEELGKNHKFSHNTGLHVENETQNMLTTEHVRMAEALVCKSESQ